ncbi:MAG TPA: FAD-dependent oxidoreductase [Acidimicrobiia bacterium]|nr:FAD-dependent oxidoreductase [Acidimicrobiia bacterium]
MHDRTSLGTRARSVAVVGSGISGLGAAWALSQRHDVTVYEADHRIGGHSHTVDVSSTAGPVAVDTGFIVYNEVTYPNLTRLFTHLGVDTEPSDMSFSYSDGGGIEYASHLRGMLAQPSNLLRRRFLRMLGDINRFRREGASFDPDPGTAIEDLIRGHGYSPGFLDDYLLPMAGAIWSASRNDIGRYPARSILRFLSNHGLIEIVGRPRWRTVTGGSRRYVERLVAGFRDRIRTGTPVLAVERSADGVTIHSPAGAEAFDELVLAVHSDQALRILGGEATGAERDHLGGVQYQPNRAVLHSDPALMPRRRAAWSSWNAVRADRPDRPVAVTYWMNRLQNLDPRLPLFVTLNPREEPDPALTHGEYSYAHPQFDERSRAAQLGIASIQGERHTWFAGAWLGYGFHEDGLQSGLDVAAALGAPAPWQVARASSSPLPVAVAA